MIESILNNWGFWGTYSAIVGFATLVFSHDDWSWPRFVDRAFRYSLIRHTRDGIVWKDLLVDSRAPRTEMFLDPSQQDKILGPPRWFVRFGVYLLVAVPMFVLLPIAAAIGFVLAMAWVLNDFIGNLFVRWPQERRNLRERRAAEEKERRRKSDLQAWLWYDTPKANDGQGLILYYNTVMGVTVVLPPVVYNRWYELFGYAVEDGRWPPGASPHGIEWVLPPHPSAYVFATVVGHRRLAEAFGKTFADRLVLGGPSDLKRLAAERGWKIEWTQDPKIFVPGVSVLYGIDFDSQKRLFATYSNEREALDLIVAQAPETLWDKYLRGRLHLLAEFPTVATRSESDEAQNP